MTIEKESMIDDLTKLFIKELSEDEKLKIMCKEVLKDQLTKDDLYNMLNDENDINNYIYDNELYDKDDLKEFIECNTDPHGYYGVRQSDFM
jgi:hypothetical protein